MSRQIQVTFDAHDPRALSSFWHEVLGYVHPGPPGIDLPDGARWGRHACVARSPLRR
jgi:Glyoxalase-like domain